MNKSIKIGQIITVNNFLRSMMILYMRKKNFSFIPIIVAFMLVLQLLYVSTNKENSNLSFNNLLQLVHQVNNIKTLSITYRIQETDLLKNLNSNSNEKQLETAEKNIISEEAIQLTLHLPESFKYADVDEIALKAYLSERSSILREEPYFSSIINVGKEFNINPILLFAITGQEQGFVPQEQVSAALIANNPYNVFCSWQSYNTDIIDSSEIACRTIINLSKDRPDSVDPLVWINRKYSSDQNWHCGVRSLYEEINDFIESYEIKLPQNKLLE